MALLYCTEVVQFEIFDLIYVLVSLSEVEIFDLIYVLLSVSEVFGVSGYWFFC